MKPIVHYSLFIIHFLLLLACSNSPQSKETIFNKQAEVTIITSDDTHFTFDVELATTEYEKAQGLMFRYKLDPNQGMWFIFDKMQPQSFWMKNTYLSLDMLFIDDEYTIIDIHHNAFPLNETPIVSEKYSKYVLEILGGTCQKLGINVGDRVVYDK